MWKTSLSPFWLIRFFLRASAWFAPCCVAFIFVIHSFSLRFSDSRDPTLISDLNVSSRFWAAHLVSSAITAGSPCGCSAAYSPSAYLTLPKHLFYFIFHFPFLHLFFLSIGRLRADRCLPGEIGALEVCPSGGLFSYLSFPSSARTASENLRLRSLFATQ